MTLKLSVQLDIAANILADFKADEMANVCRQAQAIVKAWEDAPEVMTEFYSRPPMRALSGIAVDNLELLPLAGKRVKIVELG